MNMFCVALVAVVPVPLFGMRKLFEYVELLDVEILTFEHLPYMNE